MTGIHINMWIAVLCNWYVVIKSGLSKQMAVASLQPEMFALLQCWFLISGRKLVGTNASWLLHMNVRIKFHGNRHVFKNYYGGRT